MRVGGSHNASRNARAVIAALTAGWLTSCTATSGPGFDLATPSYNGVGVAAIMSDVAQSSGDAAADAEASADPVAAEENAPAALAEAEAVASASSPAEDSNQAAAEEAPTVESDEAPTTESGGEEPAQVAVETAPKKRGFLASLFSPAPAAEPAPAQSAFAPARDKAKALIEREAQEEAEPLIDLSEKKERPVRAAAFSGDALPGVRRTSLFEITHKSGIEDDSDVDIYEDVGAGVVLASAAGLARLAPNGLLKQRESVDVACLKPSLVRILKTVERHFGKRLIVTSGYRSPNHNRRVRGARRSQHMYCAAADVQLPGVSKWELAKFVRSLPGRGGVGTYCHTASVHIDVGPERDWNWRCRRRS